MNSMLQCLAQSPPLTAAFRDGTYKAMVNRVNPLGTGGKLAEAWADVVRKMFSGSFSTVVPKEFKQVPFFYGLFFASLNGLLFLESFLYRARFFSLYFYAYMTIKLLFTYSSLRRYCMIGAGQICASVCGLSAARFPGVHVVSVRRTPRGFKPSPTKAIYRGL
jgi:hypothetical protein